MITDTVVLALIIYRFQRSETASSLKELQRFQREDLTKGLERLQSMAFSLEQTNLEGAYKKVQKFINEESISDVLIISRFSAFPAFWLDKQTTSENLVLLNRVNNNKLLIGPDKDSFEKYADVVAAHFNDPENLEKYPPIIKSRVAGWKKTTETDDSSAEIKREYDSYKGLDKTYNFCLKELQGVSAVSINAIILKRRSRNLYGSFFEVIFFGESSEEQHELPEPLRPTMILYSPIPLMARLWRYELQTLLSGDTAGSAWFEEFYKEPKL